MKFIQIDLKIDINFIFTISFVDTLHLNDQNFYSFY